MQHQNVLNQTDSNSIRLESLPLVIQGMQQFFPLGDSLQRPSTHKAHELTYVRSGKIDYLIKGKRYRLVPGSTIVLRPNVAHSYIVHEACEVTCVYFTIHADFAAGRTDEEGQSFLDFEQFANNEDIESDEGGAQASEQLKDAMLIKGRGRREIAGILEAIIAENNSCEYGKTLMLQAMGLQLLVHFSRAMKEEWEESLKVKTGKAKELVFIARDYIESNYDQNITVADVAGYVYLSQGYFARAFRDVMGMSPMSFLMQVRVEQACKLLSETDMKISSIAKNVGFSSPQRFNAAFRKQMLTTPMAFRKEVEEEGLSEV